MLQEVSDLLNENYLSIGDGGVQEPILLKERVICPNRAIILSDKGPYSNFRCEYSLN